MSTADIASTEFKQRLIACDVRPGAFLTLKEISALLGIPLGATREVTQRLAREGFMTIYPQRGIQIAPITVKRIRDAFGFRRMLETAAVAGFAETAPAPQIDHLIARAESIAAIDPDDPDFTAQVGEIDWELHFAFIRHAGNEFLTEAYEVNATYIRWFRANAAIPVTRHLEVMQEHLDILQACKARDPAAAVDALGVHVDKSLQKALGA
ncbi:GntR family transcriptional regulator [Oceanomicrobium pacificus]|uniref:FCD domain-containing protein n=1 Tax=Oceanomicrobium pacificus TaxID=2692916 RepID=A0A6B0TYE2_9RHOB|nr:GntR family transcriptional regulator [Oceanomicrobium pacificus]MXU66023.1 FCD domain-containing protein [Oceanomicrobium pacificus]